MTTNIAHPKTAHHRRLRLAVAAAAILAALAAYDVAQPATVPTALRSGSVRLIDDSNDQAQLQQQLAQQEMLQSEQQAEQQNEAAQQQALQDELQAQQTEQQANNP
jgi:hypothetical protein